jgi:uncharacterized damage-inducible protein DinB
MTRTELLLAPIAYMPPPRILEGLTAEDAARPVAGAPHAIVEIVAHMVFWQTWFINRCLGMPVPMAAAAADGWPAAGAADWARLSEAFVIGLDRAVHLPADGRVEPPIEFPPLAEYTVEDALTHLAMHNAHHLGQIVTLRQQLGAWPPPQGSWTW